MLIEDEATRVRLGGSASTAADVLAGLARDPSVTVRAALALNRAAPPEANAALAADPDERVRGLLARKLAALLPSLPDGAAATIRHQVWTTLTHLVQDEAERVRAVFADELESAADAPRELILRLAGDAAAAVYQPAILCSPVLTPEDLIGLIVHAPASGKVACVARRPALDPAVCDAITATANDAAIHALLENRSARIREVTLDRIADQARAHPAWQDAMVRRPALSPGAMATLSESIAGHLLQVLANRADLDPGLEKRVRARLTGKPAAAPEDGTSARQAAIDRARALGRAGLLSETALLEATRQGDAPLAAALLAEKAAVPIALIDRAAALRSAKGLVSLAWKAGFSMRAAAAVQTTLAGLAPSAALAASADGGFPMAPEEMRWQIDFLGAATGPAAALVSGGSASPARPR